MAALDPVAYVRSTPPFHALPPALFDGAARGLEVAFYPAGERLVQVGGQPLEHLYLIRKGSVRLERGGQILQVLEEGETFGYTSLITGEATLDVAVEDDLLAYRLPGVEFRRLLGDAQFAAHFAVRLSERLRSSLEHSPVATFQADLSLEVGRLLRRPAVWVPEGATVEDAARVMRDERISSVLVRTDPPGIVTDRDFRSRVLAAGLGPGTGVTRVFSRPLKSVAADTPVYEAWRVLLEAGVHHLPVTRGPEIAGVLTATDLLKHTAQGPVAVLRSVERLVSRRDLGGYGQRVAEMAAALLAGGLEATVIAGFVARLNEALLGRLLAFAEADLGPAPAPYAWVVFGSEGRMEQVLLTDQDNGLVFADEGAASRDWFQRAAELVNVDLEAAGFPPGERMARSRNGTLSDWRRRFAEAVDGTPSEAAIYFDMRRSGGTLDVGPLAAELSRASREPRFVRLLAQGALQFGPPSSLLLRLKGASSTVDLKLHGIAPVVFLARCYAIEVGSGSRATLERLEDAAGAGLMDEAFHASVGEAYRFLLGLRVRVQLRRLAEGRPPTSEVALAELSGIERSRLKDAFRAVKTWQERAAYHYQATVA